MIRFPAPFTNPRLRMFFAGFLVVLIPACLYAIYITSFTKKTEPENIREEAATPSLSSFGSLDTPEEISKTDHFNVLLLGYGGAGHEGGFLTDVILLAHFDMKDKVLALVSIPRDLWVTLPDGRKAKINAAFVAKDAPLYPLENVTLDQALDGAVKTKSVISDVTGLEPHFFIGIDFNSFSALIDKLGGVTVDVPEAFSDSWYPVRGRELELCGHTPEEVTALTAQYSGFELEKQFPCRYEQISFDKKIYTLNGDTALKFVRSRHGSGAGDFSRSARQQALLIGIRNSLLSKKALEDPAGIFKTFSSGVRTNLNENLTKNIAPLLAGIGDYKVVHIYLTTQNVLNTSTSPAGAFILVPKTGGWEGIKNYITSELAK